MSAGRPDHVSDVTSGAGRGRADRRRDVMTHILAEITHSEGMPFVYAPAQFVLTRYSRKMCTTSVFNSRNVPLLFVFEFHEVLYLRVVFHIDGWMSTWIERAQPDGLTPLKQFRDTLTSDDAAMMVTHRERTIYDSIKSCIQSELYAYVPSPPESGKTIVITTTWSIYTKLAWPLSRRRTNRGHGPAPTHPQA